MPKYLYAAILLHAKDRVLQNARLFRLLIGNAVSNAIRVLAGLKRRVRQQNVFLGPPLSPDLSRPLVEIA